MERRLGLTGRVLYEREKIVAAILVLGILP